MNCYLEEKGYPIPRCISFSNITMEDVLTGTYLLVREEMKGKRNNKKCRILAYKNPLRGDTEVLSEEVQRHIEKISSPVKVYSQSNF